MKFILSLFFDESLMDEVTPEDMERVSAEMNEFNDELRNAGAFVYAEGLGPSGMARTLRWGERGKPVATDGPFAEAKEQLGGFWVVDCANIDEAADWAAKAPIENGAIEVRPIAASGEEARKLHEQQSA